MNNRPRVVDLDAPCDPEDVLRVMGYGRKGLPRPEIRDLVHRLVADVRDLIHPQGVYVVREVEQMTDRRLDLRGCRSIRGPIAGFLKPAKRVALFIVTIGDKIERLADRRMQAARTLEGYTFDAIGSAAAEAAADALADHVLWNEANSDEAVTPPVNPGYCGLSLDEQVPLFAVVDARAIGVQLTPGMIMQPIKSLSGLLGIGDHQDVTDHGVPCQWCELTDCRMRRADRLG